VPHPPFTKEISIGKAIVRRAGHWMILIGKLVSATAAKQKSGVSAVFE
jgi:hypothetical protein